MSDENPESADDVKGRISDLLRRAQSGSFESDLLRSIQPSFQLPDVDLSSIRIPTPEERHEYESSAVFINRLAERVRLWKEKLPADVQPSIIALLTNGVAIQVATMWQEGHNGIGIEGTLNGEPCMVITHQASLQLLCYAEQIKEEKQRRSIGFFTDDAAEESGE